MCENLAVIQSNYVSVAMLTCTCSRAIARDVHTIQLKAGRAVLVRAGCYDTDEHFKAGSEAQALQKWRRRGDSSVHLINAGGSVLENQRGPTGNEMLVRLPIYNVQK